MVFTVYRIHCLLNEKFYIGVHKTNNPHDSYLGSGIVIRASVKKYGKENFKKDILFIYDTQQEAYRKETALIAKELNNSKCMNISAGGRGGWSWNKDKKQTGVIDKDGNRFRVFLDDPRYISGELVSYAKGVRPNTETRRRMSEARRGKKRSAEYCTKRKALGITHTDETKERLSKAKIGNSSLTGRHWFNDGVDNYALFQDDIKIIEKNLRVGKLTKKPRKSGYHVSPEAKANIAAAIKGRRWYNNGIKSFFIEPKDAIINELALVPGRLSFVTCVSHSEVEAFSV